MDADRELVAQASSGSREAFDELVRRYQTRVYNLARTMTGREADAEDLAQETFVRAFRAIGRFRGESSFKTWLYRITVNVVNTHLAGRGKRMDAPAAADEGAADPMEQIASGEDVEADTVRRQVIDKALDAVPEELRTIITLRDIHGFAYSEIAELTGVPLGTVESRVFRARQRLKPLLEPLLRRGPQQPESKVVPMPRRSSR